MRVILEINVSEDTALRMLRYQESPRCPENDVKKRTGIELTHGFSNRVLLQPKDYRLLADFLARNNAVGVMNFDMFKERMKELEQNNKEHE